MDKSSVAIKYSYIALNGVRIKSKSQKLIEKNIGIGVVIDLIVSGSIIKENGLYKYKNGSELKGLELNEGKKFKELLKLAEKLNSKVVEKLVSEIVSSGDIDLINSLIGLDINFEDNGVEVKEYRTSYDIYKRTVDEVKEVLANNEVSIEASIEAIYLAWLLAQSGDLAKVFTLEEIETLESKLVEFSKTSELGKELLETVNIHSLLLEYKKFLDDKNSIFKKGFGLGVVSRFPILERKESIFIATEKMFSDSDESLKAIVGKLVDKGHMVTILKEGKVPLIDINNTLYELIPDAMRVNIINVHGVRLRRYLG